MRVADYSCNEVVTVRLAAERVEYFLGPGLIRLLLVHLFLPLIFHRHEVLALYGSLRRPLLIHDSKSYVIVFFDLYKLSNILLTN